MQLENNSPITLDKRMEYLMRIEHWIKTNRETIKLAHYKDLKKPGTCNVNGFYGIKEAVKVIQDCESRYKKEIDPKLVD